MANQTYLELSNAAATEASKLSNALVAQKDTIIRTINEGSLASLSQALCCLEFAAPLWLAMGYDYKTRELRQRLADAITSDLNGAPRPAAICKALEVLLERCK